MQKLKRVGTFFLILFLGVCPAVPAQAGDLEAWTLDPYFGTDFAITLIEMTQEDVLFAVGGIRLSNDEVSSCSFYRKNNFVGQWNLVASTPICFNNLTSSSDGMRLTAAAWGSDIYTSNDGGKNWVSRNKPDWWWFGFSSSSTGQTVIGTTEKKTFWISYDYGVSWNAPFASSPSGGSFTKSAISADGNKIIVGDSLGYLYVSTDGGRTWATSGELKGWYAVAISSNGSQMVAAASNDVGELGGIFISLDDGSSWTQTGADNAWWQIETTPNGNHLIAIPTDKIDYVFVSNNSGQSWQASSGRFLAGNVAISNSGQYVFAMLSPIGDGRFRLYFAEYKCGIGGADTCAQAVSAQRAAADALAKAAAELKAKEEADAKAAADKAAAELKAKQEAEAKAAADAKAAAELKARQEAEAKAAAELKAKQEAEAKVAADLRAKQEAEAKAAAELKAKQEADAKAAAELKAKQEAEAKAAAELKAKQEAEAKAAAELKAKQEAEAKAAAELKAKQEAEAKAAAELKAKQEAEAKAAAELKAKQEAELKVAAELKAIQEAAAKAAATKKTTITCVKGKLIKKVSAVKPKCPAGYKLKK